MPRRSAVSLAMLVALPLLAVAQVDEPMHVHVVAPGDTLIGLGRRLLVEPAQWTELMRINRVREPRRMAVGMPLRIPLRLLPLDPGQASVMAVAGQVRGADGAAVQRGQQLAEGSALQTGTDGYVTVRLVDGTQLRLRATSSLRIDEARRVRGTTATRSGVQLDSGRVEVEAQPATGGRPGFRISTPQGVLGVRGTEFRVGVGSELTRSEVLGGVVAVAGRSGGGEQRVPAGFGTVVDASGRVASPVPLLAAPDVSGLPALHERPLVRLSLPPLPGASAYRAQVARDGSFDEVLVDLSAAGPEVRIAGLADGSYRVRVRGVDGNGLEGRDAELALRLKARPEPPLPSGPQPRAVIRGSRVEFAWAANVEARSYRLQLSAGSDFATLLHDLRDLSGPTHALEGVAPGAYHWRLASVRADGDQGPFGDATRFEVRALPPTPGPPDPPAVGDDSIRFFWPALPGQTFDFQVARDQAFTQIVFDKQVAGSELELPLPGTGRFYVRMRARDADGFVGPFSSTQRFDVPPCVRTGGGACVRVGSEPLRMQ